MNWMMDSRGGFRFGHTGVVPRDRDEHDRAIQRDAIRKLQTLNREARAAHEARQVGKKERTPYTLEMQRADVQRNLARQLIPMQIGREMANDDATLQEIFNEVCKDLGVESPPAGPMQPEESSVSASPSGNGSN